MCHWLYIDIPKENMGNKGESRQIPDQDFQYPIIPDWLKIWYQYPYPIHTRSNPKYFFQYPIHTRPEVQKPYPSDPGGEAGDADLLLPQPGRLILPYSFCTTLISTTTTSLLWRMQHPWGTLRNLWKVWVSLYWTFWLSLQPNSRRVLEPGFWRLWVWVRSLLLHEQHQTHHPQRRSCDHMNLPWFLSVCSHIQ